VVEAIRNQTERYLHLMVYGEIVQSPQVEYAADLVKLLPDTLSSVYFVNSGSEAVEGAIKLAKRFTGRPGVVAFKNGYHGSTIGALSIQGDEKYKSAFRPLMPSVDFAIFNNPESLDIIDYNTAAVVIEPVQGEGGVILPENGFLKLVRERCDETGSLLIFDEIQTGFGRVGTLFAIDKYGVKPDILLLAKALGGGMPLGAFISSYEIMSSLSNNPILGHITTFGGHPVSCAAGHAALKVVLSEKLHQVANKSGERFKSKLKHPLIKTVRGEGLFIAVELVSEELIHLFIRKGIKNGLLLDYFLFNSLAFRIAPPLNITDKEIDFASEIILKTLDQL
jgi:acetylornithine/succinyldiaminopimelate/putrescine aminotransferase